MPRAQTIALSASMLAPILAGCAATQQAQQAPKAQCERLAWIARDTAARARLVEEFVSKSFPTRPDASEILARCAILSSHAAEQAKRVADCTDDGTEASARALDDLQARAEGLAEERRSLDREWEIWQVQHGLKASGDVELVYRSRGPGC